MNIKKLLVIGSRIYNDSIITLMEGFGRYVSVFKGLGSIYSLAPFIFFRELNILYALKIKSDNLKVIKQLNYERKNITTENKHRG